MAGLEGSKKKLLIAFMFLIISVKWLSLGRFFLCLFAINLKKESYIEIILTRFSMKCGLLIEF